VINAGANVDETVKQLIDPEYIQDVVKSLARK
jgi:hypothetical protein